MKKISFLSLILFLSLIFAGCNKGKAFLLKKTAEEITKNCPMEVDYMTVLESCEYMPDNTLKYNYVVDVDLGKFDKDAYYNSMKSHVIQQMSVLLNQKESKPLKALDPIIIHSYKTQKGEFICEIEVTPEMYNKPIETKKLSDDEMFNDLQQTAKYLNPSSPIEIEEDFFLTEVKAFPPRILEFNYRMEGVEHAAFDSVVFKDALVPALIEEVINDKADQSLKDNGVVFRYVYHDQSDIYLCSIVVTPKDYN